MQYHQDFRKQMLSNNNPPDSQNKFYRRKNDNHDDKNKQTNKKLLEKQFNLFCCRQNTDEGPRIHRPQLAASWMANA